MKFKSIVGHEDIIKYFKCSIEMNKVSHAYIIEGEVGSGKKMLANAYATTLQCELGSAESCGKCKSCIQSNNGNQPDIITVTHEKPGVISVDEIRSQVVDSIDIKPYSNKYKIYIIPDAQLMNQQAQNALLKTIEEPPAYAVIILLVTNINRMLPTVQSRSMIIKTKPIREVEILDYLKEVMGLDEEKARFCLDFSQGNLGKAIKLATNEEYAQIVESVVDIIRRIPQIEADDLAAAISQIEQFKLSIDDYLDLMTMWYRDILMLKIIGKIDKLIFKTEYRELKKQAEKLSYNVLEKKIEAIARTKTRLEANANFDLTMELLLLTLKEN